MTSLLERLPDAYYTAVTENAENAGNEFCFHAVALYILIVKKAHKRLRQCQSFSFHDQPSISESLTGLCSATDFFAARPRRSASRPS